MSAYHLPQILLLGFKVHAPPKRCRIIDRTKRDGTLDGPGVVNVCERIDIEEQDVAALAGLKRSGFFFGANVLREHNCSGLKGLQRRKATAPTWNRLSFVWPPLRALSAKSLSPPHTSFVVYHRSPETTQS